MKFVTWIFFIALLIAFASAGVIPQEEAEYLPPLGGEEQPVEDAATLAEDGYRYKTVRNLRHRRDVSELVESAVLSDDGYHYPAPEAEKPLLETSNEYLPPTEEATDVKEISDVPQVSNEYLPPVEEVAEIKEEPVITEAPIVLDVPQPSEVSNEYLPPVDDSIIVEGPTESAEVKEAVHEPTEAPHVANEYLPPAEVKEDVPEPTEAPLVANEYLPPVAEVKEVPEDFEAPVESAELADDGYRYKTIRRLKYRHRRDVSEIVAPASGYFYEAPATTEQPTNVYLPPAEVKEALPEPREVPHVANEYLPPAEVKEAVPEPTETSQVANEYLPPVAEVKEVPEIVEAPVESAELADDGYRYKTIRRLKYRHRRDVSEIVAPASGYFYEAPATTEKPANVYLPPAEVKEAVPEPSEVPQVANEYLPPAEVKEAVPEPTETSQVANEYLPPVAEVKEVPEIVEAPVESAELADDGYRYKTIRRLKYRHRRDVSEIVAPASGYFYEAPATTEKPANAYLPPAEVKEAVPEPSEAPQVANEYLPPAEVKEAVPEPTEAPQVSNEYLPPAELKDAPKTSNEVPAETEAPVVTEAPVATEAPVITEAPKVSNEYLPPSEEVPELKESSEVPETAVLADDGYHYKTNEGFRFRRDVSEIVAPSNGYVYEAPAPTDEVANLYLPPVEAKEAVEPTEAPQVSNEYLPPVEESKDDAEVVEAPKESAVLADDGYHYKTVRRLKYRQRRDVSEITAPKNAPNGYFYPSPVRQAVDVPVEDSAVLADDGYHYKTVRRIRYRHRRDVSEIVNAASNGYVYEAPAASEPVANEYLPPVEQVPEVKTVEVEPTEATAEVSNEYLPPAEETQDDAEIIEAPEDSAVLGDDGYRYKTLRRIR